MHQGKGNHQGKDVRTNGSNRHHRSGKTRTFRYPCCDSVPSVAALGSFPSVRSGSTKAKATSEERTRQRDARQPRQGRCGNGSNNHHRATRQERSDSLVAIPFPPLRLLARSLLSDQKAPRQRQHQRNGHAKGMQGNQGKDVAAMGATTITEPQGKNVPIPLLRFRSLRCGCWLVPFCQIRRHQGKGNIRGTDTPKGCKATKARTLRQWEQQPSQSHKARTFRFPCCDSVPSVAALGSFPL